MPLLIRCPDCEADNRVGEDLKGKTVTCKLCGVNFKVGKEAKLVEPTAEEKKKAEADDSKSSARRKSGRKDLDDDEDDDERPRRKKRSRDDDDEDDDRPRSRSRPRGQTSGGMTSGQQTGAAVGGGIVVVAIIGIIIWQATKTVKDASNNINNANQQNQQIVAFDQAVANLESSDLNKQRDALRWFGGNQPGNNARRAELAKKMVGFLNSNDQGVVSEAVGALKLWGSRDNGPAVAAVLSRSPDRGVRERAMDMLGTWKDERAADAIIRRLGQLGEEGRAVAALKAIGAPAETAVANALSTANAKVQGQLLEVLLQTGTKRSLPALEAFVVQHQIGKKGLSSTGRRANEVINAIKARET